MKKIVKNGYIWECPICSRTSKRVDRCRYTARKYGVMHLLQKHQRSDLAPIIKEWSLAKKTPCKTPDDGEKVEPLKQGQFWYEIAGLPKFPVSPMDILIIPRHTFVKKRIYQKILKREG